MSSKIQIDQIVVVPEFNIRADCLVQAKVAEYVDIFAKLPPVSGFHVEGILYLVDGWHRLEAAKKLELKEIDVEIVGQGSLVDAQDWADTANLKHGIMLTPEQRREIAVRFANRHPDWSLRQIADVIHCSHMSVKKWIETSTVNKFTAEEGDSSRASQSDRAGGVDIKAVTLKFKEWFNRTVRLCKPEAWPDDRKERVRQELRPIVEFYNKLGSNV